MNEMMKWCSMSEQSYTHIYIDVQYHFVKEAVKLNIIDLIHIPRAKNIADLFTHPTTRTIHKQMRNEIMNINSRENTNIGLFMQHINDHSMNFDDQLLYLIGKR